MAVQFGMLSGVEQHWTELALDPASDTPLYKQLAGAVRSLVDRGAVQAGERLPATRELAGQLGLNRTTVSAAYAVLEESGPSRRPSRPR